MASSTTGPWGESHDQWHVDQNGHLRGMPDISSTLGAQDASTTDRTWVSDSVSVNGSEFITKDSMKALIKEAIRELMAEDEGFAGFLQRRRAV